MPPAVISGNFGSGTSPILADGLVVLVRDEMKDPRILAFDALTGAARHRKRSWPIPPVSYCPRRSSGQRRPASRSWRRDTDG